MIYLQVEAKSVADAKKKVKNLDRYILSKVTLVEVTPTGGKVYSIGMKLKWV